MSLKMQLRGIDSWRIGLIAAAFNIVVVLFAYCSFGAVENWFVIVGLLTDIIGAVVLALPDLPSYEDYFFAGQLEEALRKLRTDFQGSGRVTPSNWWYESLRDAIDDFVLDDIPEDAWFEIDDHDRFCILNGRMENVVTPIAFRNVERELTWRIKNLEGRIRRNGIILIVVGFLFQLLGHLLIGWLIPHPTTAG